MKEKIQNTICGIFRMYGCDKTVESQMQQDRLLIRCMNELSSHPGIEKKLTDEVSFKCFVMQTLLEDAKTEQVTPLC